MNGVGAIIPVIAACVAAGAAAVPAAETLLGRHFEIETASRAGTEVVGKVHLLSNRLAHRAPVPDTHGFRLAADSSDFFAIGARRDSQGRLFGALVVAPGRVLPGEPGVATATVELVAGGRTLGRLPITIRIVDELMLDVLLQRAQAHVRANSRLYGRRRYSDEEVARLILELEATGGRFRDFDWYDGNLQRFPRPTLETEWEEAARRIGGLGYAYATSNVFGANGDTEQRGRLRDALRTALGTFAAAVPIAGSDVLIDGKPIGDEYGDGLFLLQQHGLAGHNFLSHQWRITDPITGPAVWLMPELAKELRAGDAAARRLHEQLVRIFQISFGSPASYRKLDDRDARWGQLTDRDRSAGAFSDANLGHRIRGWVALPAIWADHNRPITYTPYWYADYGERHGVPHAAYMPGWTPTGVLEDLAFWVAHFHRPAHRFGKSGFHPDGTVTHHLADASDIAMAAYGFGWLTDAMDGYEMLAGLPFDLGSHGHQFIADRLLYSYDKMLYHDHFDIVVSGRSYWGITGFRGRLVQTVDRLLACKPPTTVMRNGTALRDWRAALAAGTHEVSGNYPFWVGNYLVHRRGGRAGEAPFFVSVKMKNDRTTGAEDFEEVVKSWHLGSGILQAMVRGDEYALDARRNWDWHVLPGLTEEWRTDAIPYVRDRLRGANAYSGMASDGRYGFAAMDYRPSDNYATARADKAWFFTESATIALGTGIARRGPGQGRPIVTTLDQTRWVGPVTTCVDGRTVGSISADRNPDLALDLTGGTAWIHQGGIGYAVLHGGPQTLLLCGGSAVNATEPGDHDGPRILQLALDHGVDPTETARTRYVYAILPNVSAGEMPGRVRRLAEQIEIVANDEGVQGVFDRSRGLLQLAFRTAGAVAVPDGPTVSVDRPVLVQLRRDGERWSLCVTDPLHDPRAREISLSLTVPLRPGEYPITLPGIHPLPWRALKVERTTEGSRVTVPLPSRADDASLNYQAELYAGAPIHVTLPVDTRKLDTMPEVDRSRLDDY